MSKARDHSEQCPTTSDHVQSRPDSPDGVQESALVSYRPLAKLVRQLAVPCVLDLQGSQDSPHFGIHYGQAELVKFAAFDRCLFSTAS